MELRRPATSPLKPQVVARGSAADLLSGLAAGDTRREPPEMLLSQAVAVMSLAAGLAAGLAGLGCAGGLR